MILIIDFAHFYGVQKSKSNSVDGRLMLYSSELCPSAQDPNAHFHNTHFHNPFIKNK